MVRNKWLIPAIFVVMLVSLFLFIIWAQNPPEVSKGRLTLATGNDAGQYYKFGKALGSLDGVNIRLQATEGSAENLELLHDEDADGLNIALKITEGSAQNLDLLRAAEVDLALVQNDLAQDAILGARGGGQFKELRYILPIFPEFIQILVAKDSKFTVLADLRGKRICIGDRNSGTYFSSFDLFDAANLVEGVDYMPIIKNVSDCLDEMQEGGEVDATIVTSSVLKVNELDRVKQIQFSDRFVKRVSDQIPYMREVSLKDQPSQLVIDAYLASSSKLSEERAAQLAEVMIDQWGELQKEIDYLPELPKSNDTGRVPFHTGSIPALQQAKLRSNNWASKILIWAPLIVLMLSIWIESWRHAYDRLGYNPNMHGWRLRLIGIFGWCSRHIIAFAVLGLVVFVAMKLLLIVEESQAQEEGRLSPFAHMGVDEGFIWLFTYIGNGFVADDIYPVSFIGKSMVAALAVVGFSAPVGYLMYGIDSTSKKREKAQEGFGKKNFKNHVVICGWNEKAKGIIATLTGTNVPSKQEIVIVAEPEERYPLIKFAFNNRKVGFCRGSPADRMILESARIRQAKTIVILADFSGNLDQNKGGVLAAMAAREMNPQAHICAELEYDNNLDLFAAANCQTMISTRLVACRIASMAAFSMDIVDFVFDCVTYHDSKHDEIYSIAASEVIACHNLGELKVSGLRSLMLNRGINIVGVVDDSYRCASKDASFVGENDQTLVDSKYRNRQLAPEATILYAARSPKDILKKKKGQQIKPARSEKFSICYPKKLSILVLSDPQTLEDLESELQAILGDGLNFVGVDNSENRLRSKHEIEEAIPQGLDRCMILHTLKDRAEIDSMEDVNETDSETMILARLLSNLREERKEKWPIIGEIANFENQNLVLTAGADYALPISMVAERFIAKEVYDPNHAVDFLMASMQLRDQIHLIKHIVRTGDGFCGESYQSLLAAQIEGVRILGWRSKLEEEELKNTDGDFNYHYRMVVDDRIAEENQIAMEGDTMILLARKRDEYPNCAFAE